MCHILIWFFQAHHRCVSRAQVLGYIEDELDRGDNAAGAKYAESSMRNGFGLKFLHKFLNLPFLTLQRESLVKQLETNAREMQATVDELDLFLDSDDANYQVYSSGVTKKRRAQAESLAPAPTIGNFLRIFTKLKKIVKLCLPSSFQFDELFNFKPGNSIVVSVIVVTSILVDNRYSHPLQDSWQVSVTRCQCSPTTDHALGTIMWYKTRRW